MPLLIEQSGVQEFLSLTLEHNINVYDNARTTELIVFSPLNINLYENSYTSETLTRRLDSNISIIDKYYVQDIVNTEGLILFPLDKIFISESLNLILTNLEDRIIIISDDIYVSEFLFDAYKIFVYDDSYSREFVVVADFNISIIENIISSDHYNVYEEVQIFGPGLPIGPTNPLEGISYPEHLSADLLKGDKYFETVTTFWNQPFPTDLLTENGNKANFSTTFNKTHTSIRNRKCSIRAELIRSDNSTQIVEIGTFLMGTSEQEGNVISIQLEDLTKKLIETPADDIKSGFQWYRNIPLTNLVEELVKKSYPDPRNGEIPRDYIIQGVRPPSPTGKPLISSLGKPPTFTRLTNNLNTVGKTNALVVADLGIRGERLYLGVGKFIYEYDEITQTYLLIGEVNSSRVDDLDIEYQIKKLWFNEATAFTDKYLYGMAWPKEELTYDDGEFESDGVTLRKKRYSCITSNDYIIFKANNDGVTILFDSAIQNNQGAVGYTPTLFSGEYHILEPYTTGYSQSRSEYDADNFVPNAVGYFWADEYWPKKALHTGYGSVKKYSPNPGHTNYTGFERKERKPIYWNGTPYHCGYTENMCIPFAQKVGWGGNFIQDVLWESWLSTVDLGNGSTPGNESWTNHIPTPYESFYDNFGFVPGPEDSSGEGRTGWFLLSNDPTTHRYGTFEGRPRLQLKSSRSYTEEAVSVIRHYIGALDIYQENFNFVILTKEDQKPVAGGWTPGNCPKRYAYETHELLSPPHLPLIHYEQHTPEWENLPYETVANHKFNAGYYCWNFEGSLKKDWNWSYAPIGWTKYTSGQSGSVTYLKNWGTKGGVFFEGQIKYSESGLNSLPIFKTQGHRDLYTDSSSNLSRRDLILQGYIFDLDTKQLNLIESMQYSDFRDTREDANRYPYQITAVTPKENSDGTYDLIIAAQTFPFKHFIAEDQSTYTNRWKSKAYIMNFRLKDFAESGVVKLRSPLTQLLDGPAGDYGHGNPDYVIIDLNSMSNSEGNNKIFITYYEKQKLIKEYNGEGVPLIGNCYGLAHIGVNDFTSILRNNAFDYYPYHEWLMPYPLLRIVKASSNNTVGNNYFYAVEPMDRTEESNSIRLRKFCYDDTFYIKGGTFNEVSTYYDKDTTVGWINDAIYGESNQLSNLVSMVVDDFEIIYGVSDSYYQNPINKTSGKNHLWKYDIFLGGIIELADLSNLSTWDAIVQLAEGFNFITGFDKETFFFIPKSFSQSPDILIDADLDGVIEISKIRDYKVENIVRTTPYISKVGDVEWEIVVIPNETTANDTDRVELNADLRVRQEDDLTKTVTLRVFSKGLIPESATSISPLRFSYLNYNNVIETKLVRDLGSNDIQLVLPSFYGQDLSAQVRVGDVISLEETDETSGNTNEITRTITSVDYNSNVIFVNLPFDKNFKAFTPVTIYRSFTNSGGELRNNQWSDQGVTYISSTWISGVWNDETGWYTDRFVTVGSIRNLSVGTIIRLGDYPTEHIIYDIVDGTETSDGKPGIYFRAYRGNVPIPDSTAPIEVLNNMIIRAYWTPTFNDLTEVGGSKVFIGFAPGSTGTFWMNFRGEDKINIKCPGLILEADNRAIITVVDSDSIERYGKSSVNLDENRFIQIALHEYMARNYLHANSKPRLQFRIKNFIQTLDKGGYSYMLPIVKLLNTSEKRLFTVRVVSKKLLPRFWGYFTDCYIMEHSFNLKTFIQEMLLKSKDTY